MCALAWAFPLFPQRSTRLIDLRRTFAPCRISHHLKVLREAVLISGERRGTWVYYRVDPAVLAQLSDVLSVR